jgi:hypothetical protein
MTAEDAKAWLLAEATVNGRPMLVRSRDPSTTEANPGRPHLLVVSFSYPVGDDVQLPSPTDYARIASIEGWVFDGPGAVADLVFVETASGVVRYFCYTADVDGAAATIEEAFGPDEPLDFAFADDPQWLHYRRGSGRSRPP